MERRKNPFTCYFCHKKIENESEVGHTSVCGNVLVPCPQKCGAYVPRMDLQFHQRECPNRVGRSMPRLTAPSNNSENFRAPESLTLGRRPIGPSKELLEQLQQDIHKLSGRLTKHERTSNTISLDTWKSQQDLDKVKYETGLLLEWKKGADYKLESLKQTVISLEKAKTETDVNWVNLQRKLLQLDQLRGDISIAQNNFLKEQNYNRQANLEFAKNFDEFREIFDDNNASNAAVCNDHKRFIDEIFQDIATIKVLIEEQKAKNASVVFDVKTISQIASEAAEKVEIQEREFNKIKEKLEQMQLDFEIIETLASADARTGSSGHLIWKITNFEAKMTKSKESGIVIKSPIFYTHDYGYKIRILVYLNGLKKWKGRYALISIHVLKGEFDALLKWPCQIDGSIILRDLENLDYPKHFSKRITAKRQTGDEENEEPQESSLSYIFIPHGTITKGLYLKNDELYLEFRIDQKNGHLTETML